MSGKGKKKTGRKIVIWSAIIILIASLIIISVLRRRSINGTEVVPSTGDITTYYSFSGSVEAINRQTAFADKAMQIKAINVSAGQKVMKDDVLMTTRTGEEIKAAIDGEVANVYIDVNAQLMPGSKLFDIVDYDNLQLKVLIDEYDLPAVSEGKDATVTIKALNKDIHGKFADISKEGTYSNGVTFFNATITLDKDSEIKVGMSAEAKVLNKSVKNVITLPMTAIQFDDQNNPCVYVKEGRKLIRSDLELGLTDGVIVEVKSGLATKEIVIVPKGNASLSLRPGIFGRASSSGNASGNGTGGNGK